MRIWPRAVYGWGSRSSERKLELSCDEAVVDADETLFRGVDVDAPPATVFRWLCQLRAAPYSYDLIDNLGRRSPQRLTPGLERLAVGQRVMSIFRLAAFEQDRSITIVSDGPLFGRVACTYLAIAQPDGGSRLVAKLKISYRRGWRTDLPLRVLLPAGDLVMMRRQLLNLKALAEAQASTAAG
jgi:hypothetical protein